MLDGGMNCSSCREVKSKTGKEPVCYFRRCPVSQLMLDSYVPYIGLWTAINGNSFKETGLASEVVRRANLKDEDFDILLELDSVYVRHRKKEQEQRQVHARSRRR